jgi:hypothetical protein
LLNKIGQRFRQAVTSFAEANDIPWAKFEKNDVGTLPWSCNSSKSEQTSLKGHALTDYEQVDAILARPNLVGC